MSGKRKNTDRERMPADVLMQHKDPGRKQKLRIIWHLSVPTILAQLTSILMQYIDTAMVGGLGADASAAVGVISISTWLLSGLCSAGCGKGNS